MATRGPVYPVAAGVVPCGHRQQLTGVPGERASGIVALKLPSPASEKPASAGPSERAISVPPL